MSLNAYSMTVELFIPMLTNLGGILAKGASFAEAKKLEAGVLENARLAPDMFALRRQIGLTSDFAKLGTARLAGIEAPKFEDNEASFPELQERVAKTIAWLRSVKPEQLEGSMTRQVIVPLRTRTLDLQGADFLRKWVLPNFFFHLTTAYAILRSNGVEVGKNDFLGSV
ncbi:MAG: DUF1993 domain-containing protein [Steroidobacteraceae bacterium]